MAYVRVMHRFAEYNPGDLLEMDDPELSVNICTGLVQRLSKNEWDMFSNKGKKSKPKQEAGLKIERETKA